MSPARPPSTGLPLTANGASSGGGNGNGSGGGGEEEEDGDFADWDESAPLSVSVVMPPATGSSPVPSALQPLAPTPLSSARAAAVLKDESPPPPPEPDYFSAMGLSSISSAADVNVTRVAAKRPLPTATPPPPSNNASSGVSIPSALTAASSNARSSRFTEDLLEADAPPANGSGWGADDLDSLLPEEESTVPAAAASPAAAATKPARKGRDPSQVKKPRGIGAVAVQLDDE